MDIKIKIGLNIKNIRIKKGLTQEELSISAGMDRGYISNIEQGKRNISVTCLEKIAIALEIDISDLFK